MMDGAAESRASVPGLERGLNILRLFRRDRTAIGAPEIARELGIPRSTVHRLVQTLEEMGFLRRAEHGGAYALGPAVLTIGFEYLGSLDIVQLSNPVLTRLRDETNYSTHLAIRNGTEIVYLSRHASRATIASNISVGSALPAHATVIGRVILADLDAAELAALFPGKRLKTYTEHTPPTLAALTKILADDRERGYATSTSFYENGVTSVAAPVRDRSGRVVASVSAVTVEVTLDEQYVRGPLKDRVVAAAAEISELLGASDAAVPVGWPKRFGT
jgi:DNA-binding IclR family transcriptional regulator